MWVPQHLLTMSLQGAKDSKDPQIAEHVRAQLHEKIETTQDPRADTLLAAGKAKLQKKPHDKQTELTSKLLILSGSNDYLDAPQAAHCGIEIACKAAKKAQ